MPHPIDNHSTTSGAIKPSLEECRAALEKYGPMGNPIVLHDWRSGDAGRLEAMALAHLIHQPGVRIAIIPMDLDYFEALCLSVAHDKLEEFKAGKPIVVHAIFLEERPAHPRNRPDDTERVRVAKTATEANSFGSSASQTVIELSRNSRARAITRSEAKDRSVQKLAPVVWMEGGDPDDDSKKSYFLGLVDRGRRKAVQFFNKPTPRAVAADFENRTRARIAAGTPITTIATGIMGLLTALASHLKQTIRHESAMYRWARNAAAGRPVEKADARDIANAHLVRQSATELMQVAIAGGMNPAEVHGNLLTARQAFDTGRKVGLLLRGTPMTVTVEDAEEIRTAIETVRRGPPETDADGCYYYLADALAQGPAPLAWEAIAGRILASGASEVVAPERNLT